MKRELIPYNVMRHADWDRAPRDPVSAAIATAITGATAGAVYTAVYIAATIAVSAVTSWALQALAPKPDFGRFVTSSAGLLVNDRNGIAPHDFIYGEVRKGGAVVYDETTGTNNKFLHRVIALAGHEVEEIGDIYLNDEIVETGGFEYTVAVTYTKSGGKEGTPTTKIQTMTFTGVPTEQATYEVSDSLGVSDISALEDASYESTVRKWSNSEFDSASVSAKTQLTDGTVVTGPYAGKIRINKHLGDQTTADADLLAESENDQIDASFVGNGIAYIYARFEYDQDVFANGLPLITAKIKGKKVFDPRDDTTAYSNNAALCLRDFLTASYGLQDSDIDEAAFQIAANECDEAVALAGGGTEPKYTMNGVVRADQTFGDVLQQMTTCCTGTLFWGMGAWDLVAGAYSSPVQDFGLDDLRGPISVDPLTNLRDAFNAVSGTFSDASQDYITVDYPTITSSVFEAEDGGERLPLDLELPFTTSAATAQRIAKLTLFRAREQIGVSADFSLKAFNVEVGDIITFTNPRYGWDEKQFEVVGWNLNIGEGAGISVRLDLRETSEAAYDWNAEETAIIANNTNLPDIFSGLDILNLSVSGGGRIQKDGTFFNSAIVSWDAADNAFVARYEVQWKPSADSEYSSTFTSATSLQVSPILDGIQYDFRVRAITVVDNTGSFASTTFTGGGDTTAPSAPTGLTATADARSILLTWDNPSDVDLNIINIYEKEAATPTPVVGTDVPIASAIGQSHLIENILPLDEKFYWITAVDHSGNESVLSNVDSATADFLPGEDLEDLSVDTIKVVDDAVTSIVTFNASLPYVNTIGGEDQYGDFFTILSYVDNPQLRPNIFGALKYSVSGTAGSSPQVRLNTQVAFLGSGGSLVTLAQTETIHTGADVFGEFMHNITYDSVLNVNGSGLILARAYIQGITSPTVAAQGYGMARRR